MTNQRGNIIVSGAIYGLCGPDGEIRYIGYTSNTPEKRLKGHLSTGELSGNSHKNNWIKSIGKDNISIVVLEYYSDISLDDLWKREIEAISAGKGAGLRLTNNGSGGEGATGVVHTAESRRRMSEAAMGKVIGQAQRDKIAAHNRSRVRSDEERANNSKAKMGAKNPMFGKTLSDEHKAKLSAKLSGPNNILYGKPLPEETRRKLSEAKMGKPSRGGHSRWHSGRGIVREDCVFCQEVSA